MIPLDHLLDLFPSKLLARLAVRFRVNQVNQIKLPGQTVCLCLLNTLVNHPVVSQRLLKATDEKVTGQTVDHSSFSKRLATVNPDYFEALYQHVYQKIQPLMAANDERGLRLRRVDRGALDGLEGRLNRLQAAMWAAADAGDAGARSAGPVPLPLKVDFVAGRGSKKGTAPPAL